MIDNKDDGKGTGWKALFTGASATNGALFGSILGPLGALGGALIMGGITLAITSLADGAPEVSRPKRAACQERETLTDNNGLLALRDRVSCVLDEIARPREGYWTWADVRNEAAGVLPVEVQLIGSAVEVFPKWKLGYDESNSAGPALSFLAAIGQGLIGHWGGAAASVVQAGIKAHAQERSYRAFLDSDKYLAACGTIMIVYDAEILSTSLIILKRATATEHSDGHGGSFHDFGGKIVDRRDSRH